MFFIAKFLNKVNKDNCLRIKYKKITNKVLLKYFKKFKIVKKKSKKYSV